MKICRDGRIWGQNNKNAGGHLGILTGKWRDKRRGTASAVKMGRLNPFYGRKHSMETKLKMGDAKRGEKHYRWKGGISSRQSKLRATIEFRLWREAVFARDNWTCQECERVGWRLNAHHIKSFAGYPKLRFAIDNGVTLCYECHKKTENYGGGNNQC